MKIKILRRHSISILRDGGLLGIKFTEVYKERKSFLKWVFDTEDWRIWKDTQKRRRYIYSGRGEVWFEDINGKSTKIEDSKLTEWARGIIRNDLSLTDGI